MEAARETARSSRSTASRILAIATFTIVYFLAARVGIKTAIIHPGVAATWMPAGISLAACLIFGTWIWPAIFLGALLCNAPGLGPLPAIAIAAGNALEAFGAFARRAARTGSASRGHRMS